MTPLEAQTALAILDLLLTGADKVAEKVAEARRQGLISVDEQATRKAQIDALRLKVSQ
jgi:hypothetical protein